MPREKKTALNKKILCFIDEFGTGGDPGFGLGCVMIWVSECGKADKAFSDILPANVNEVHAVNWDKAFLQSLLARYAQTEMPSSIIMLNSLSQIYIGTKPQKYAYAVIEAVKTTAKRFRIAQKLGNIINNIEVIIDANEQNTHRDFEDIMKSASKNDGVFRGVSRVIAIDSTVSRVLQIADVVAYSRNWVVNGEDHVDNLRENYKINII